VPTNAPDRKGKTIKVVDVPKLIGIGYFNATSKGIADAAAEMGTMDAKTDGPTKANIDDQITSSTTTSLRASTASCSPPTIRWPSRRC
jgi:ABC-type sugar transport system substrate-binding protein